jgi:hypothetical protein
MGFGFTDIWKAVASQKTKHAYFKPKVVLQSVWEVDETCTKNNAADEILSSKNVYARQEDFLPELEDDVPKLLELKQRAGFRINDTIKYTKDDRITVQALKDAGYSAYEIFTAEGTVTSHQSPLFVEIRDKYKPQAAKYYIDKQYLGFKEKDLVQILSQGREYTVENATYKTLRMRDFTFDEVEGAMDAMAPRDHMSNVELANDKIRLLYVAAGFHDVKYYVGKANKADLAHYPLHIAKAYANINLPPGALKEWFKNVEKCRTPMRNANGGYIDTTFTPFTLKQLKAGGFDATDIVKHATDMEGNRFKDGGLFSAEKMRSLLKDEGFADLDINEALKEQEQEKKEQKKGPSEFQVMPGYEVAFDLKFIVRLDGWQKKIGQKAVLGNPFYNLGIEPTTHPKTGQLMIKDWFETTRLVHPQKHLNISKASKVVSQFNNNNLNVPQNASRSAKQSMNLPKHFPDVVPDMLEYYAIASVQGYEPATGDQYDLVTSIKEFTNALERKVHPEQRIGENVEIIIKKIKKLSKAREVKVFIQPTINWEIDTIFTYIVTPDGTKKGGAFGFGGQDQLLNEWYNLGIQPAIHESTKHVMIKNWFLVEIPGAVYGSTKNTGKQHSQFNTPKNASTPSGQPVTSPPGLPENFASAPPDQYFAIDSVLGYPIRTEHDLKATLEGYIGTKIPVVVLLMKRKR